jgi:CheY-like chemotaxis protein
MRVLIVQDEPDLASFLSSLLLGAGLVVDRVGSTEEAFQALENAPFDVSIVDQHLVLCRFRYRSSLNPQCLGSTGCTDHRRFHLRHPNSP